MVISLLVNRSENFALKSHLFYAPVQHSVRRGLADCIETKLCRA